MSKDFEQAYRELAQNEIPDLWDRIEAGLSEKSTPEKEKKKPSEKRKHIYYGRYVGMAAAVLCVALIIPAALFLDQSMQKSESTGIAEEQEQGQMNQSGMNDSMMEESSEAAAEDVGAEKMDELVSSAETVAEAADDTSGIEDYAVTNEDSGSVQSEDMDEMRMADAESKNKKTESLSSQKQRGETELADDNVIEKVTVKITEETAKIDNSENMKETGAVYTAIIDRDETGFFEEGEKIEIFVPLDSSTTFIENTIYEVDLIYRRNEKYPFLLKSIQ